MQNADTPLRRRAPIADWLVSAALFVSTFLIYLRTLAPTVAFMFDDSLEFQLLAARMAIAHPTGYPLYSILLKLFTFLPFGDIAYRVNLASALFAAWAVAFVYLAARLLTARFMTGNTTFGEILVRAPALIATLAFALGETFWSQAVIAEVYALQAWLTAVMLWLALAWGDARAGPSNALPYRFPFPVSIVTLAFWAGLMLTHHRLSVLVLPALAVYLSSYDRAFWKQGGRLVIRMALAFTLPLLLYLYLPLRGMVTSSLDGAYQNTPQGFLNWILGTGYTVFLTENPFEQERAMSYYVNLFLNDFSTIGLVGAVGGLVALFLRAWREWLLLALGLGANLAFAMTYRVADINVFFIPAFVFAALFLAAGLAGSMWLIFYALPPRAANVATGLALAIVALVPIYLYHDHYDWVDLSYKGDIYAYGQDILSQPLPENATIIGILGEMSLLRYFQETQNLRPDVETIAADQEDARLVAVQDALERGRAVFLTRPLANLAQKYSLSSFGPLIRVQVNAHRKVKPTPTHPLAELFGDVKFLGYDVDFSALNPSTETNRDTRRRVRVTLYWEPQRRIRNNRFVSLKLIGSNGRLAAQLDRHPVLDAYPTTAWRSGQVITDTYDLPIFVGAPPGEYTLQVTLYDPESGEIYGQRELERVTLARDTRTVHRDLIGVQHLLLRAFDGLELVGYDLETSEPFAPGATVSITQVWRVLQSGVKRVFALRLVDMYGKVLAQEQVTVGGVELAAGEYTREERQLRIPKDVAAGTYVLQLAAGEGLNLPFFANAVTLGEIEVQVP